MIPNPNPRPDPAPEPGHRNNPYLEKVAVGAWMSMEACLEFLEDHQDQEGRDCDCLDCDAVRGVLFMARMCESVVSGQMGGMPHILQWLRQFGFPPARALAEMICARFKLQEDDRDE